MATIDQWGVPDEYRGEDGSVHVTALTISDLTLNPIAHIIRDLDGEITNFPYKEIIGDQLVDRIFNKKQTKILIMAMYVPELRATDIIILDHPSEWPNG